MVTDATIKNLITGSTEAARSQLIASMGYPDEEYKRMFFTTSRVTKSLITAFTRSPRRAAMMPPVLFNRLIAFHYEHCIIGAVTSRKINRTFFEYHEHRRQLEIGVSMVLNTVTSNPMTEAQKRKFLADSWPHLDIGAGKVTDKAVELLSILMPLRHDSGSLNSVEEESVRAVKSFFTKEEICDVVVRQGNRMFLFPVADTFSMLDLIIETMESFDQYSDRCSAYMLTGLFEDPELKVLANSAITFFDKAADEHGYEKTLHAHRSASHLLKYMYA